MTTTHIHLVPISAFIQYSARRVPMLCSSSTHLCARLIPNIIQNFGMLQEENQGHGFCLERRLHVDL
jgi:hypothetical protein